MKRVLLTGATGFIGRNIKPVLEKEYDVFAPTRSELDLRNAEEVLNYLKKGNFDAVIQSANPNPVKNMAADKQSDMFQDSMSIFMNFYRARSHCGKVLYLGSGAEFDKRRDIRLIKEEQFGESIPVDVYGFSKYIMNELAVKSDNVYNLRIFACYGPTDHESKFITHAINCCKQNEPVTIRQDCYFDYMHVSDLAKIICWFIDNKPMKNDYNISTGRRERLSDIAKIVCEKMGNTQPVRILAEGLNKEYTADNSRLLSEMGDFKFLSLDKGIDLQIESQK